MSTLCLLHQARHSWSSSIGCKWQLAGKTDAAAAFLAYLFAVMLLLMLPQQCTSIPFHCEWCCWILYFILLFIYHLSSPFSQCQCSSDMQSVFVCLSIWKRGFLKFKWQLCKVKKCIYIPHLHSFTYLVTSRAVSYGGGGIPECYPLSWRLVVILVCIQNDWLALRMMMFNNQLHQHLLLLLSWCCCLLAYCDWLYDLHSQHTHAHSVGVFIFFSFRYRLTNKFGVARWGDLLCCVH